MTASNINIFNLIKEEGILKSHKDELIAIPKLETKSQRLMALKDWCHKLGAEGFDIELALKSLNKNRHLFRYRASGIWALWLYCNYIPREKVDIEFVWAHYLFNNMCKLKDAPQAFVWLELMSHSNIVPYPLPQDLNKLIDSGIVSQLYFTDPKKTSSISTLKWSISDTDVVLNSLSKRKMTKYLVEGIGSTWDRD